MLTFGIRLQYSVLLNQAADEAATGRRAETDILDRIEHFLSQLWLQHGYLFAVDGRENADVDLVGGCYRQKVSLQIELHLCYGKLVAYIDVGKFARRGTSKSRV